MFPVTKRKKAGVCSWHLGHLRERCLPVRISCHGSGVGEGERGERALRGVREHSPGFQILSPSPLMCFPLPSPPSPPPFSLLSLPETLPHLRFSLTVEPVVCRLGLACSWAAPSPPPTAPAVYRQPEGALLELVLEDVAASCLVRLPRTSTLWLRPSLPSMRHMAATYLRAAQYCAFHCSAVQYSTVQFS